MKKIILIMNLSLLFISTAFSQTTITLNSSLNGAISTNITHSIGNKEFKPIVGIGYAHNLKEEYDLRNITHTFFDFEQKAYYANLGVKVKDFSIILQVGKSINYKGLVMDEKISGFKKRSNYYGFLIYKDITDNFGINGGYNNKLGANFGINFKF